MSMINIESVNGKPYGLLTPNGAWADKRFRMFFYICDNAACDCTNMTIALADLTNQTNIKAAEFAVDIHLMRRSDKNHDQPNNEIIDALVKEFDKDDWMVLWTIFSDLKLEMTEKIDFNRTFAEFPMARNIESEGELVPYNQILPFGAKFTLGNENSGVLIDEQYCLIRGCECSSVLMCFVSIQSGGQLPGDSPTIRVNYRTGAIENIEFGSGTKESILETWNQFKQKYPDLLKIFSKRHKHLNKLYEDYGRSQPPKLPVVKPVKSTGRNDPCPCGSGKKYKKCCIDSADFGRGLRMESIKPRSVKMFPNFRWS